MSKAVKISIPLNATPGEEILLKPYLCYTSLSPKVKYLKNAFITSTGIVCGSKGLIKECYHYNWEGQSDLFLFLAKQFYYAAQEDIENLLTFDDEETYLLIHHPWYTNYYHWLNEALYRLWLVRDKADQMVLLLPQKDKLSSTAIDSLGLFNFKRIVYIPEGKIARVRTLCMPAQKPNMYNYNANALLEINKTYINYVISKSLNVKSSERIYLSRKNSLRRRILNEEEVIKTLVKYNFIVVYSEEYTFFEQVSLFSQAKYLAGNHGAGLTNMLFMPPGSTVIEFLKRSTNPKRHQDFIFWYMADALSHRYYNQTCESINTNEPFFTADIAVDIKLLRKNLELIFTDQTKSENHVNVATQINKVEFDV